jgi:hypothetical protein
MTILLAKRVSEYSLTDFIFIRLYDSFDYTIGKGAHLSTYLAIGTLVVYFDWLECSKLIPRHLKPIIGTDSRAQTTTNTITVLDQLLYVIR